MQVLRRSALCVVVLLALCYRSHGQCHQECDSDTDISKSTCVDISDKILRPPWGKQFQPVFVPRYRVAKDDVAPEDLAVSGHYQECENDCCECWLLAVENEMANRVNHDNQKPKRLYDSVGKLKEVFEAELKSEWVDKSNNSQYKLSKLLLTEFPKVAKDKCMSTNTRLEPTVLPQLPCGRIAGGDVMSMFNSVRASITTTNEAAKFRDVHIPNVAAKLTTDLFRGTVEAAKMLMEKHEKPTIGATEIEEGFKYMVMQAEPPVDIYHITHMRGPKKPDISGSPAAMMAVDGKRLFTEWYMGAPEVRPRGQYRTEHAPDDRDLSIAIDKYCGGDPGAEFPGWK